MGNAGLKAACEKCKQTSCAWGDIHVSGKTQFHKPRVQSYVTIQFNKAKEWVYYHGITSSTQAEKHGLQDTLGLGNGT